VELQKCNNALLKLREQLDDSEKKCKKVNQNKKSSWTHRQAYSLARRATMLHLTRGTMEQKSERVMELAERLGKADDRACSMQQKIKEQVHRQ
jgi:hypothetical protein